MYTYSSGMYSVNLNIPPFQGPLCRNKIPCHSKNNFNKRIYNMYYNSTGSLACNFINL